LTISAFLEWYPKFTPNIITIHFGFWIVSDKIAATVIIGFIVVKITQALIFILMILGVNLGYHSKKALPIDKWSVY
jgi:uncharacterized membrane protein